MLDSRWHDYAVNTNLFLQFQDLTTTLAKINYQLDFTYGSFVDIKDERVTVSTLWKTTKPHIQRAGYQTDIYLRTLGTLHRSNIQAFQTFWDFIRESSLKNFASQLVTLLEDIRLEDVIKRNRPGTNEAFTIRTAYLKHYFTKQLTTSIRRGLLFDELFCMIYLTLRADSPDQPFSQAKDETRELLEKIKPLLYDSFSAKTTADIVHLVTKIVSRLSFAPKDMINTHFTFPILQWDEYFREQTLFDELTRTDDVANDDVAKMDPEKSDYDDETFSTWHHESEDPGRQQTFLQMDLDVGTKTNLSGGSARETESGDQAFASVAGMSRQSKQSDYSKRSALERQREQAAMKGHHTHYGIENVRATKIIKHAKQPTKADKLIYDAFVARIEPYKRKLIQTIEKVLEQKQTANRDNLRYGRLSKQLLPIVMEEHPRIFYKKNNDSSEFDAVFTLMVDCSASMYDKMDETKHGVVLFHEVLKALKIPHKILGFWEEASSGLSEEYPNYFHMIHSFSDSLYEQQGAKIMQLEPEDDNRDGYSLRVVVEKMLLRQEKHKLLLVFSDGEPSAQGYEQQGIMDTHRAVSDARKQGIDVVGMFLAKDEIAEQDDKMMQSIYGNERVMVPQVEKLPERFLPVLKKLILKTM